MMRINKLLILICLLGTLGGFSGCVYTPGRHVHLPPAYGPPPHAPAHGYRHRLPDGLVLVYDASFGVYTVTGYSSVYYFNGIYYRQVRNRWESSPSFRKRWRVVNYDVLPGGLQKKYQRRVIKAQPRLRRPVLDRGRDIKQPGRRGMERPVNRQQPGSRRDQGPNDSARNVGNGRDNNSGKRGERDEARDEQQPKSPVVRRIEAPRGKNDAGKRGEEPRKQAKDSEQGQDKGKSKDAKGKQKADPKKDKAKKDKKKTKDDAVEGEGENGEQENERQPRERERFSRPRT